MKKVLLATLAALLLTAGAVRTSADGGDPVPLCYPNPCPPQ
jgi:hypothetical protein